MVSLLSRNNNDVDKQLSASVKKMLLERILFKEAKMVDEGDKLSRKYTALNSGYKAPNLKLSQSLSDTRSYEVGSVIIGVPKAPVELFSESKISLKWKAIRRIGPGLANLGNTCFLNSVLQVLTYTPPLSNHILEEDHKNKCKAVGFCMLCELSNHVTRIFRHNPHEGPVRPMSIIQKLKCIGKNFRFGRQEDAHEFLRYVVEGIQKSDYAGRPKLDKVSKETTMANAVFGGYYRSQVKCLHCQHESNTFDPMMDLNLDIKECSSIIQALHKSIRADRLDGENKYHCERCRKKTIAQKRGNIHKEPNVLTFQLKRFDFTQMFGGKISKNISFPEELNIRPFMSSPKGCDIYFKLYAVLVHSGYSCNSGHYYCYVKAPNGTWYEMNDNRVCQVGLQTVLSAQAYLLFYVKKERTKPQTPLVNPKTHVNQQSFSQLSKKQGNDLSKSHSFTNSNGFEAKFTSQQNSSFGIPVQRKPDPKIVWNNQSAPKIKNEPKILDVLTKKSKAISKSTSTLTNGVDNKTALPSDSLKRMKSEGHLNSLQKLIQSYDGESDSPVNSITVVSPSLKNNASVGNANTEQKAVQDKENNKRPSEKATASLNGPPLKEILNATKSINNPSKENINSHTLTTHTVVTSPSKCSKSLLENYNENQSHHEQSPVAVLKQKLSLSLNTDSTKKKLSNSSFNGQAKFNRWTPITKAPLHPRVIINRKQKEETDEEVSSSSPTKAVSSTWNEESVISPGKLFGPMLPPPNALKRKRNDSLNSEASSISSVHSRSGDWDIFDKHGKLKTRPSDNIAQKRQHAGWKVLVSPPDQEVVPTKNLPKIEKLKVDKRVKTSLSHSKSSSRKRKYDTSETDEDDDNVQKKKKRKKKKSSKKHKKHRNIERSSDEESELEENTSVKKKKKKKKKKKRKHKRKDDSSSSNDDDSKRHRRRDVIKSSTKVNKSSDDNNEDERQIKKQIRPVSKSASSSEIYNRKEVTVRNNQRDHPKAGNSISNVDGDQRISRKSRKSDTSKTSGKYSSDDELDHATSEKLAPAKTKKEVPAFQWDETKKKVKAWDGSKKTNSTLQFLLGKSTQVSSWTGEDSSKTYSYKENREKEKELEQDDWDEEYDTGKTKKRKKKIVDEYDEREKKNDFQNLQDHRNYTKDNTAVVHRSTNSRDHKQRHCGNHKKKNKHLDEKASRFF